MAIVYSPNPTYSGDVAGVRFQDGWARTDDPAALTYFRRKGYTVNGETLGGPVPDEPVDARTVGIPGMYASRISDEDAERIAGHVVAKLTGIVPIGTALRDAAVDPQPGDYLVPTNAGEADPHGPEVVAPGIHGVEEVRTIAPGDVPEAEGQELKEEADTEAALDADAEAAAEGDYVEGDGDEQVELVPVERPANNASQEAWAAYAVSKGADPEVAAALKRDELIANYGQADAETEEN